VECSRNFTLQYKTSLRSWNLSCHLVQKHLISTYSSSSSRYCAMAKTSPKKKSRKKSKKQICYCNCCGGIDGDGKELSYDTYTRHQRKMKEKSQKRQASPDPDSEPDNMSHLPEPGPSRSQHIQEMEVDSNPVINLSPEEGGGSPRRDSPMEVCGSNTIFRMTA